MMKAEFDGKVFFYCCPPGSPENQAYQHPMICLAEGFRELGIEFYADRNYWRISPATDEYLFQFNPDVTPDDCAIVIMDTEWFTNGRPFPEGLFKRDRRYITAYFGLHELMHSMQPEFRQFDFIFRGYYNQRFKYPANIRPWAFGLTERILRETKEIPDFSTRQKNLIVNFRHSKKHIHSVRKTVEKEFLPAIRPILSIDDAIDHVDAYSSDPYHHLQWVQTGKRHYPGYYKRLRESVACACFGGFFVPPVSRDQRSVLSRTLKRLLGQLGLKAGTVLQWDSWRFWEALAAGCVAFHIDLEKYGCLLPEMPENWRHYVGIDLNNVQAAIARLMDEPELLETISVAGRQWALEHYSPVPTALRFLETVSPKLL
ncbi:MAG: glycosyltransferase family 1 protein [Leptolyngbyaceae cyanobacterium RU_5_1]|nr:glycosyltransferase family 1 protein [Leptolyngbyaceae cyanobacterium RU_5_1]